MKPEECIELFERYVYGKASNMEIARLTSWIKNNPQLSAWLEDQIENSPSEIDPSIQYSMLRNIQQQIAVDDKPSKTFSLHKNWWFVAASILLPIITALSTYYYLSDNEPIEVINNTAPYTFTVDQGQKASIVLPDGTKVWLNSKSKLVCTADFNIKDRDLKLIGEAYFEVAHNKDMPFRVKCNDISIEALGTAFVVKAYEEDETVSSVLINGKVRVGTPGGEEILSPNERIEYDKKTHTNEIQRITNASDFTGWRENELRFENESLREIAKCIERTYNVKVVFGSKGIEDQYFTGTINNSSLESLLNILGLASSLQFKVENQQVILLKK